MSFQSQWEMLMNNRPDADNRDTFEEFHHDEVFALEMEIRHVMDGAGPEAVAAMPGVEKVRRVWLFRLDNDSANDGGIEVNFKKEDGKSAWISFPGGNLTASARQFDEREGSYLPGECYGPNLFLEIVHPCPGKLAAFKAGHLSMQDPNPADKDKAAAHVAMTERLRCRSFR